MNRNVGISKFLSKLWIMAVLLGPVVSFAEMADSSAWRKAEWIGFTQDDRDSEYVTRLFKRKKTKSPKERRTLVSPLLRKSFMIDRPVGSAHVLICGLGLYELYLNDQKVGDHVLDPAPTSYDRRSFYTTYDVTAQIQQGRNAIGLMLGNGFYGQDFAFGVTRLCYGAPRAKLLLAIEFTDNSSMVMATDKTWKAAQSPIIFNNIYAGETYDARLEQPGWSAPDFDDAAWQAVEKMDAPTDNLVEQRLEPMRKIRAIRPRAVLPAKNGEWILDMGENMTGWLEIRVNEPRGKVIEMRFAEHLMSGGQAIDTSTTGVRATGCEQKEIYICKGGGETWEPRFTYHGFRYVQIKGLKRKPDLNDYTGWCVRTDLKRIGSFECSDPLINKFYEVSLRTIEGNLQGLLSDCPHREKCAWLGDIHATAETICMNYAARSFWSKQIEDFKTVLGVEKPIKKHYPKGQMPTKDPRAPSNIALGKRLCGQARPDWGMAVVLVPWFNWLYYGDKETAANAWEMMDNYMEFLAETSVEKNLIKEGFCYGDWCPPGGNKKMDTPPQLSASALYYRSNLVMAQMAKLLGKHDKEEKYGKTAAKVKTDFNAKFFNNSQGGYGTQTANSMALDLGLVPDGQARAVAAALNKLVTQKNGAHYTTGIMGHRYLYTGLNDNGFSATTRKLWKTTDYPSLGFMTEKHDLTTWPERVEDWSKNKGYGGSFNHAMQSGFAVTFHESLGGIRPDPDHPGFSRFILKPCFLLGLEWCKATYDSPRGMISSSWKRKDDVVIWNVKVPEASSARVELPPVVSISVNGKAADAAGLELAAGDWQVEVKPKRRIRN